MRFFYVFTILIFSVSQVLASGQILPSQPLVSSYSLARYGSDMQTNDVSNVPLSTEGRRFKRNVATVIFSSLGGGILGLSTLSFYGRPQEHTENITTGVLLGFLGGLSYVIYSNFQDGREAPPPRRYPIDDEETTRDFSAIKNQKMANQNIPIKINYSWNF